MAPIAKARAMVSAALNWNTTIAKLDSMRQSTAVLPTNKSKPLTARVNVTPTPSHNGHGLQDAEQVIDAQEGGLFGLEQYDERAEYEEDCVPASSTDESLSSEA